MNKCICCHTYEINKNIGEFCSQICKTIYLREDLQWMKPDSLARIALNQHNQFNKLINKIELNESK